MWLADRGGGKLGKLPVPTSYVTMQPLSSTTFGLLTSNARESLILFPSSQVID